MIAWPPPLPTALLFGSVSKERRRAGRARPAAIRLPLGTLPNSEGTLLIRSSNCPQCGSSDVFVIEWPKKIVQCLVCKRRYLLDQTAGRLKPKDAAEDMAAGLPEAPKRPL